MNRCIFANSAFFKALYYTGPLQRKRMIEHISPDQIEAISKLASKILQGTLVMLKFLFIPIVVLNNRYKEKLKHYKCTIQFLANQRISTNRKKRTMLAFHNVLPKLIKPILHLLDEH